MKKYIALTSQKRRGASKKKEKDPADVTELLEKQLGVCSSNLITYIIRLMMSCNGAAYACGPVFFVVIHVGSGQEVQTNGCQLCRLLTLNRLLVAE